MQNKTKMKLYKSLYGLLKYSFLKFIQVSIIWNQSSIYFFTLGKEPSPKKAI